MKSKPTKIHLDNNRMNGIDTAEWDASATANHFSSRLDKYLPGIGRNGGPVTFLLSFPSLILSYHLIDYQKVKVLHCSCWQTEGTRAIAYTDQIS